MTGLNILKFEKTTQIHMTHEAPLADAQEPKQNIPDNQTTNDKTSNNDRKIKKNQRKIIAHNH